MLFNTDPFERRDALNGQHDDLIKNDPFGRLPQDPGPDPEIADLSAPEQITAPVGIVGQNRRNDVAKTEKLLGDAGTLDLRKTDGPTGYWGKRTEEATKTFQKQHGLKVDGDPGPKTRAAVTQTIARHGPGRVREAKALGALNRFAKEVRDTPAKVAELPKVVDATIKPLVGDTETANRVLQAGLNDLDAPKANAPEVAPRQAAFEPLREDGVIGDKTQLAFTSLLNNHGPDDLAKSIGGIFGFS